MGCPDHAEPVNPGYCPKCYAVIPQGGRACPRCSAPAHGEGLLSRIVNWLRKLASQAGMAILHGLCSAQGPVVRRRVFKSWDEVPPDVAARIQQARQSGSMVVQAGDNRTGGDRIYSSWDQVPEDLRRRLPPSIADRLQHARQNTSTVIKFQDETTGEDRTFTSWDEVPEELKERIPPEIRQWMAAKAKGDLPEVAPADVGPGNIVVEQTTTSTMLDLRIEDARLGR